MRKPYWILLLLISTFSFAQYRVRGFLEIQRKFHFIPYSEANISTGVTFPLKFGSISILGIYEFGGNLKGQHSSIKSYKLNYHFLGGGIKYRILKTSSFYSPYIQISSLTEIYSPYKGSYLGGNFYEFDYYPINGFRVPTKTELSSQYTSKDSYCYYYISTPFTGNIIFGNEFQIFKGLNLNLGVGFSMRAVKAVYKSWYYTSPEPKIDLSQKYPAEYTHWIKTMDIVLGINYTFPLRSEGKQTKKP